MDAEVNVGFKQKFAGLLSSSSSPEINYDFLKFLIRLKFKIVQPANKCIHLSFGTSLINLFELLKAFVLQTFGFELDFYFHWAWDWACALGFELWALSFELEPGLGALKPSSAFACAWACGLQARTQLGLIHLWVDGAKKGKGLVTDGGVKMWFLRKWKKCATGIPG